MEGEDYSRDTAYKVGVMSFYMAGFEVEWRYTPCSDWKDLTEVEGENHAWDWRCREYRVKQCQE